MRGTNKYSLHIVYKKLKNIMKQIYNLTPHAITIVDSEGSVLHSISSTGLARLRVVTVPAGFSIQGIPVTKTEFGQVEGLPEFNNGTYYIVSQLIKSAFPERKDLLVPAEVVRDSAGIILGCKSLGI